MNEPTILLSHSGQVIEHCEWIIEHYVEHDAYVEYDCGGAPNPGSYDIITSQQFRAINGMMSARAPEAFRKRWCDRLLPELRAIPRDLDLIDGTDSEVEPGIFAFRKLVRKMAEAHRVGDVAATRALHLLRPRFVAISASPVRTTLGIHETQFCPPKGEWYAAKAEAVQRAIRALGRENKDALATLHTYTNHLPSVTTPLSKVRVLDILLWAESAIHGPRPNPECRRSYEQVFGPEAW